MVYSPWSLFCGCWWPVNTLGSGWYTHLEVCFEGVDGLGTSWDQDGILTLKSVWWVLMVWAHSGIRMVYSPWSLFWGCSWPGHRMVYSPWSLFWWCWWSGDILGSGWYTHLEVCFVGSDGLSTPYDQDGILILKSVLRVLMAWVHPAIRMVYSPWSLFGEC